jgi:hypothetical protein
MVSVTLVILVDLEVLHRLLQREEETYKKEQVESAQLEDIVNKDLSTRLDVPLENIILYQVRMRLQIVWHVLMVTIVLVQQMQQLQDYVMLVTIAIIIQLILFKTMPPLVIMQLKDLEVNVSIVQNISFYLQFSDLIKIYQKYLIKFM